MIGVIADVFSVGRPFGVDLAGIWCVGQVFNHPVFCRNGENIPARVEQRPFSCGRYREAVNVVLHVFVVAVQVGIVEVQADGYLFRFAGGNVHCVEGTAILIHQFPVPSGGPHHIEILVGSQLGGGFCDGVVSVEVQPEVAVRGKDDVTAPPGGPLVGTGKAGDLFCTVVCQVIDPEIGGTSALVAFPGTEFPVHRGEA